MAHYAIRIAPQGPLLVVLVGVSAPRKQALIAAGQPVPPPVPAQLLVDTGATGTAIDVSVIGQLGIQPTGTMNIRTPSTTTGTHTCSTYDVELTIAGALTKHFPAHPVIDGMFSPQGIHGLLGRDILKECRMTYGGPDGFMLLSF
jgi:hypothetical protein